ncbi:hypothetical protein BKA93DRAFT_741383 [Sparassis latifolia]
MNVKDSSRDDHLNIGLAPSFGTLDRESIKNVDEKLKVMIVGTTKLIAKMPPHKRSWDNIVSVLMQNPLIEPLDDGISRADKLIKEGVHFFKFDGAPELAVVREVHNWFVALIADEDVLNSTKIDIDVMGSIVAQTAATVVSLETLIYKQESHSKTLVDIGVLRYPDPDHPYFKVYRIKLTAWSQSTPITFIQGDENGITGEYNVRRFRPRASVIAEMREEVTKKAAKEAESLFD